MKKMWIALLSSLLLSTSSFAADAIKKINFATEATYPPFEFIDASGQIQGFDIDLAKALCQQMQAECTFSNQAFNSLIPSLQLGKFDAIVSALGVTEERAKQVSFTNAYYEPSGAFVAPLAKHATLAAIEGKTIGVQTGSTFEKYLQDNYKGKVTIKSYASIQETFLDLTAGRIDWVLADTPIALTWLKQDNHIQQYGLVGKPIVDAKYFGTGYGIAVNKDNAALLAALNQALATIKANGTYQKLMKKYFN